MSSYDDTDALVPPGVARVPRSPGVTLISIPAAGPSASPPPAPPASSPPSPPPVASHPVQPQPVATDALAPPGAARVPPPPGITLIPTPPPAPTVVSQPGPAVSQPQPDYVIAPPGAGRVPQWSGVTLISVPTSPAAPTVTQPPGAGQPERVPSSADGGGKKKPKPLETVEQKRAAVVAISESQKRLKYVYGTESPGTSFDCSGLVQWTFRQIGIDLPRTSEEQYAWAQTHGAFVPQNKLQPGDIVFYVGEGGAPPAHVGIYVGNGMVMQALSPKWGVNVWPITFVGGYMAAYRVINK